MAVRVIGSQQAPSQCAMQCLLCTDRGFPQIDTVHAVQWVTVFWPNHFCCFVPQFVCVNFICAAVLQPAAVSC
jgi:hypothetical protein